LVADWSFGIQDDNLQKMVDEARAKGAQVVALLSHNGMDVDLKLASRVSWHRCHLRRPHARRRAGGGAGGQPGGTTLVTNAGSNSKFLGLMDFDVKAARSSISATGCCRSSPTSCRPTRRWTRLITKVRAPYEARLAEKLAITDGLLYRRGNFNGSWDQLICDALIEVQGAQIAFSPGFRWGTTLLPGDAITRELMMDQLAITYPYATLNRDETAR